MKSPGPVIPALYYYYYSTGNIIRTVQLPYLEKKQIITYVPEIQMLDLWKDI
jgi:hypothetical protein